MKKTVPKPFRCDTTGALYPTALGHAGLAQLVEHLICNQGVGSSSLLTGTIHFGSCVRQANTGVSGTTPLPQAVMRYTRQNNFRGPAHSV